MPETNLALLPKFLTEQVAKTAIGVATAAVMQPTLYHNLKRKMFHVVVLVPEMDLSSGSWPDYPTKPYCIAQMSFGDKTKWPHEFDEIAQCKALQLWHDRADGGTDTLPHLLFPNDTPFWGGVKRSGIVVTCSGVQPWFDRMIAGMTADICIALAYNAWMHSDDHENGADFLT